MVSNLEKYLVDLVETICYLKKFTQDQPDKILEDTKCYTSLILLGKTLESSSDDINFDIFVQQRFDQVISNYLNEIFKIRLKVDFQTKIDWDIAETVCERNEILAQTFSYVIDITNEILGSSVEFCSLFVENDGLRICLEFLADEAFLNKNEKVNILSRGDPVGLPNFLIMIVANLATKTCDQQKPKWKSLNTAEILLRVVEIIPETQFNSFSPLAYLLDDKQIETLFEQNEMKPILDALLSLLVKVSFDLRENDLDRQNIEISLKGNSIKCEIHHVDQGDGILASVYDILGCLYKLALNDSIKQVIYFDDKIKGCFKTILEKGCLFIFLL